MANFDFENGALWAVKKTRGSDDVTYQKSADDGTVTIRLSKNFLENKLDSSTHVAVGYYASQDLLVLRPTDANDKAGRKITPKGKGYTGVLHFKHDGFPVANSKVTLNDFEFDGSCFYKSLSIN
ncbi:hypothetical protein [Oleidesulfovibrio alaskensis]